MSFLEMIDQLVKAHLTHITSQGQFIQDQELISLQTNCHPSKDERGTAVNKNEFVCVVLVFARSITLRVKNV